VAPGVVVVVAAAGVAAAAGVVAADGANGSMRMNCMQATSVTRILSGWLFAAATLLAFAQPAAAQRVFDTPEAAVQALVAAAKADDETALVEIFGAQHRDVVVTSDKVQDRERHALFVRAAAEYQLLRAENDGRVTLLVGAEAWPLPMPLVKSGAGWHFDAAAGAEEIINRRIGRNELSAIEVLRFYVDAQRQYAAKPRDGTRVRQFAQHLGSTPGKKDGLYWDADASTGEELSPFGPLVKNASSRRRGSPYNGYYYKILKSQGPAAPAGRYNYVINGRMIAGYALVAYPADYGNSGVKTFIVNHYGDVYEKDLGPNTARRAAAITEYNPDSSWKLSVD
jgi:hypothetical protein